MTLESLIRHTPDDTKFKDKFCPFYHSVWAMSYYSITLLRHFCLLFPFFSSDRDASQCAEDLFGRWVALGCRRHLRRWVRPSSRLHCSICLLPTTAVDAYVCTYVPFPFCHCPPPLQCRQLRWLCRQVRGMKVQKQLHILSCYILTQAAITAATHFFTYDFTHFTAPPRFGLCVRLSSCISIWICCTNAVSITRIDWAADWLISLLPYAQVRVLIC